MGSRGGGTETGRRLTGVLGLVAEAEQWEVGNHASRRLAGGALCRVGWAEGLIIKHMEITIQLGVWGQFCVFVSGYPACKMD